MFFDMFQIFCNKGVLILYSEKKKNQNKIPEAGWLWQSADECFLVYGLVHPYLSFLKKKPLFHEY